MSGASPAYRARTAVSMIDLSVARAAAGAARDTGDGS